MIPSGCQIGLPCFNGSIISGLDQLFVCVLTYNIKVNHFNTGDYDVIVGTVKKKILIQFSSNHKDFIGRGGIGFLIEATDYW